jgi:transposase
MGGDRFSRLKDERDWMLARIAAEPGMTLAELHQELCERGVRVGYLSLKRFLKKEKMELGSKTPWPHVKLLVSPSPKADFGKPA